MKISITKDTKTLRYAAQELAKYLEMMDESICPQIVFDTHSDSGITLGLLEDLSLDTSDVEDAFVDDVTDVNVKKLCGYIAGSNERSVLFGVYNFLKSAGCMWVRPGVDGEYIPKKSMKDHVFVNRKKADTPFRGQCIEGAVSIDHVLDALYFMPKVNMNLFMIQFVVPYNIMNRWYKHEGNTVWDGDSPTYSQAQEYVTMMEKVAKKCGMALHSLGHGYLFAAYGIQYKTPKDTYQIDEECISKTALVKGKRGIYHGSLNFTQLCYSDPAVRQKLVDYLVSFVEEHRLVDYLHIWLADYVNNHCECPECVKKNPSDFYVMLLNELDEALTKKGIDTRLVFITYTDTLWPPIEEKLNNPSRFTRCAACSRKYNEPYTDKRYYDKIPDYKRNSFTPLLDFSKVLSHNDAWNGVHNGKKFLFEYFLYTNHFFDPGYVGMTKDLYRDMKDLSKTGFEGIMSCQTQRCAFPTALPTAIFGETLYDTSLEIDSYSKTYYEAAFGENSDEAVSYLREITRLFDPDTTRATDSIEAQDTGALDAQKETKQFGIKNRPELAKDLEAVYPLANSFAQVARKNKEKCENVCQKRSWELLEYHTRYVKHMADIYIALALGNTELAKEKLEEAVDALSVMEKDIHREFDLFLWERRMTQAIAK